MRGVITGLGRLARALVNSWGAKGLNWHKTGGGKTGPGQEELEVLKGTGRRVVIVRSPDPKVFEEAIFIVREDYLTGPEQGRARLLREARKAADGYITATLGKRRGPRWSIPAAMYTFCAAMGAVLTWLTLRIFALV